LLDILSKIARDGIIKALVAEIDFFFRGNMFIANFRRHLSRYAPHSQHENRSGLHFVE